MFRSFTTHFLLFIAFICCSSGVLAEEALYKKIVLSGIDKVSTQGFIAVDIVQGDVDTAELYLRKGSVNHIQLLTESINDVNTLHIKEVEQHSDEKWDKTPIAHIVITLRSLQHVQVHDTYRVVIKGFESDVFHLKTTGKGFIEVSELNHTQQYYSLLGSSTNILRDIAANRARFIIGGTSKVAIEDVSAKAINARFINQARISAVGLKAASFKADVYYRTQFIMRDNSQVDAITLKAFNQSIVDFTQADVKVINARVVENANVALGEVKMLSAFANKNGVLTYIGEPTTELKVKGEASIKQVTRLSIIDDMNKAVDIEDANE